MPVDQDSVRLQATFVERQTLLVQISRLSERQAQVLAYRLLDDMTQSDFEAYRAKQFIHVAKGKEIPMPYFVVPNEVLDNSKMLALWMEKAFQAALRNLAKKSKKKKRQRGFLSI